jgi:hypothetical protein
MVGSAVLLVLVMLPQIDKTPRKMRSG